VIALLLPYRETHFHHVIGSNPTKDHFFITFPRPISEDELPEHFSDPFSDEPHPLCILAAEKLQKYLRQQDWEHNFGLESERTENVIGKMFGVLVVRTAEGEIGYLSAFSGKMGGKNHYPGFVPPVYDGLKEGSFLNLGMQELTRINREIEQLMKSQPTGHMEKIDALKDLRRNNSMALQDKVFDHYHFLNRDGEEKSLRDLFPNNPPGGAGECAGPKLLQHAFIHHMQPLAMAEFWWGQSPKSGFWKHRQFYPACRQKCEPILAHMLWGTKIV
jgi:tRNA pseudouridine32 synthase / 23S rRNA pseudouridine746 synthase